jgi:hypothetical protein
MRIFFRYATVAAAFCVPSIATAYVSGEGHEYRPSFNASGMVFTSVRSVSRYIEAGAGSSVQQGREILYLGKRCDAYSAAFGRGTWGWANGGILVSFTNGQSIGFPRQELDSRSAERFGWSIDRCKL